MQFAPYICAESFIDDVMLERQLMTLRDDLDLSEDYLFLVPSFQFLQSVKKLEVQIKDNAAVAYSNVVKVLKRKRGKLGRNSHINTLIRYHIKLGFYAMLARDHHSAIRCFIRFSFFQTYLDFLWLDACLPGGLPALGT
jgi:hypothetical protein